jgi:hypothetical protein
MYTSTNSLRGAPSNDHNNTRKNYLKNVVTWKRWKLKTEYFLTSPLHIVSTTTTFIIVLDLWITLCIHEILLPYLSKYRPQLRI